MDLNSILESISKEQTKPRLKERPLSESEVINAYSTIASERYAILTEYSNIRINAMRSYSESDEDVIDAEPYDPDEDVIDAEPYDPDPEATKRYKNRYKQKSVSEHVWDIIKKAVKALITILKSLVQKVLNLFKKRKQPMEDAIEVEIQTYNEIKETLLLEYIPNNETKVYPIITDVVGDFNFFGYRNLAFDNAATIKKAMLSNAATSIDNCMNVFNLILKDNPTSNKVTQFDILNPKDKDLDIIKKELGCVIKMVTVDELIEMTKKDESILIKNKTNLKKFGEIITSLENDVKMYTKYLEDTIKNSDKMKSGMTTGIEFRSAINSISNLFTGFNSVVTYMTSFYYKFSAATINLIRDAKTKILEGGNK